LIAIQTENLSKQFKISLKKPGLKGAIHSFFNKEYKIVHALKNISFQINRGELVGFLGPNGAGKTTTLKLLSGLLYPTSGKMTILGYVPFKREELFLKKFSMVMGQRTQLWWDLPARETFALNQKIYEIPEIVFKKRKEELIEILELKELVDVPVKKLSLGERMKAELACALLHEPEILLLDEPTLGLDLLMQKKLRHFILEYNKRTESTIVLTSHNMSDVEELCKRVMIVNEGQLLYDGELEKIVEHYTPEKLVTLSSSKTIEPELLKKFGRMVSINGTTAKIEVARKEVASTIQKLFNAIPLIDLSIEELPIEEIIRRVFSKIPSQLVIQETNMEESLNKEETETKKNLGERLSP